MPPTTFRKAASTAGGAGVLLVSEDLDELLSLSDRVAVMVGGELKGPYAVHEVTRESLGLIMGGAHPHSIPGAEQGVVVDQDDGLRRDQQAGTTYLRDKYTPPQD